MTPLYKPIAASPAVGGAAPLNAARPRKRLMTMKQFMDDVAPAMEQTKRQQLKDAHLSRNEAIQSNKRWVDATGKTLSSNDRNQAMQTSGIKKIAAQVDDDIELDI